MARIGVFWPRARRLRGCARDLAHAPAASRAYAWPSQTIKWCSICLTRSRRRVQAEKRKTNERLTRGDLYRKVLVTLSFNFFKKCTRYLIRPKCITILYHNSPLFIDIFHVMMLFL